MYLHFLPLGDDATPPVSHDGGIEHTEAEFASVPAWIEKARRGTVIMYEPQAYLINVVGGFMTGKAEYEAQRNALLAFAKSPPTGPNGDPAQGPAGSIPWADKAICPYVALSDDTGRAVLALESSGPELSTQGRGGDYDRVVLVRSWDHMPREVELMWRKDAVPHSGQDSKL
jgi:hypothetical protein